jgi:signal peptidase II
MIYIAVIAAVTATDQLIKLLIRVSLSLGESLPVIENILHITHISNSGGAFGILQGQTALLLALPAALVAAIIFYIVKNRKISHPALLFGLSLICGGGIGNLIDRAVSGRVTDFIDFRVFPVFNTADVCVCCGCGIVLLYMLFIDRKTVSKEEGPTDGK